MQPIIRVFLTTVVFAVGITIAPANPNHLEPINTYGDYDRVVFNALIGRERGELWEICMPSFSPEFALILRSQPETPKDRLSPKHYMTLKWFLEVATAAQQIWLLKEHAGFADNLAQNIRVARKQIEIEQSLAHELQKCWVSVLSQTRRAREKDYVADGVIYQFYAFPYFGQTHSPNTGLPTKLVELASQLGATVRAKPPERKSLLDGCLRMAKALQASAKTEEDKPSDTERAK
jgi:hypothetical protein